MLKKKATIARATAPLIAESISADDIDVDFESEETDWESEEAGVDLEGNTPAAVAQPRQPLTDATNNSVSTRTPTQLSGAPIPPRRLPFHSPASNPKNRVSRTATGSDPRDDRHTVINPASSVVRFETTLEEILLEVKKTNEKISSIEQRVSLLETSSSSSSDNVEPQKRKVPNRVRVCLYSYDMFCY